MSTSAAHIRPATPQDAAMIARLLTDFNTEFDAAGPHQDVLEARLSRHLASDSFWALLAHTSDTRPNGPTIPAAAAFATVSLRPSVYNPGPVALVEDLYVRPDARNRGIGTLLMDAVQARARADGYGAIEVQVDEPDEDAIRFYERHGFSLCDAATQDRVFCLWLEYET